MSQTITQTVEKNKHDHAREVLNKCMSEFGVTYHKDGTDILIYTHGNESVPNSLNKWISENISNEFSVEIVDAPSTGRSELSGYFKDLLDTACDEWEVGFDDTTIYVDLKDHLNARIAMSLLQSSKPSWAELKPYSADAENDDDSSLFSDAHNVRKYDDYHIVELPKSEYRDMKKLDTIPDDVIICATDVNLYYYDGNEFYSRTHEDTIEYIKSSLFDEAKSFSTETEDDSLSPSSDDEPHSEDEEEDIWSELPTNKRVMWTNKYQNQGYLEAPITDYEEDGDTVIYTFELPWGDTIEESMDISTFEDTGDLARFTNFHGYEEDQYEHLVGESATVNHSNGQWKVAYKLTDKEFEENEKSFEFPPSFDLPVYTRPVVVGVLALISIACVFYLYMIGTIGTPMILGLSVLILILQWKFSLPKV